MEDQKDLHKKGLENLEFLRKQKIFIGIPAYGGQCFVGAANALVQIVAGLNKYGVDCSYSFIANSSFVTIARNTLSYEFLNSDFTHLFFLDSDINFIDNPTHSIIKMILADEDIVCAPYVKKALNWENIKQAAKIDVPAEDLEKYSGTFCLNALNNLIDKSQIENGIVEIKESGTGCMLIKRRVFEGIQRKFPEYRCNGNTFDFQFFNTEIDKESNEYITEDYMFQRRARECGFKVFMIPSIKLIHIGTFGFVSDLPTIASNEVGFIVGGHGSNKI